MLYKLLLIFFLLANYLLANINIDNFSADFNQDIYNNNQKISYQGKIYIKDNLSLWQYLNEENKRIYINENEVVVIDDDLEQVIIQKEQIDIKKILQIAQKVDQNNYIAQYQNTNFYLYFENNLLKTITYNDELENKVIITFTKQSNNLKIDDNIFKYKIPSNYDLIRQ